jgi:hypothetical protein
LITPLFLCPRLCGLEKGDAVITGPENRRHRNRKNFLKASAAFVFFAIFIGSALAQSWPVFQAASNKDRQRAPDIFEQLINTDSSHSVGSVTAAYQEVQKRLLDNDDIRAHGKDERLPVESFYPGLDFFYFYLKALSGPEAPK